MNTYKLLAGLLFLSGILLFPGTGFAQITSEANDIMPTEYSSGAQDDIHVFCGLKGEKNAALTAIAVNGESATFEWLKYNAQSGIFDFVSNDLSETSTSTISNLEDGSYRVKVTSASGENTYTAWVFNNYYELTAAIPQSDCDYFTLQGEFETPTFAYVDLTTGLARELNKEVQVKWKVGEVDFSKVISTQVIDPPTKNTDYTFEVSDRFECVADAEVTYISIVTKASFDYAIEYYGPEGKRSDIEKEEAPLTVNFTNTSKNGDPGKYEWYFYKDTQKLKMEKPTTLRDSLLDDIIRNDSPVFTFEASGEYNVKLVSKKTIGSVTCTDTYDLYKVTKDIIKVDTSFIEAPNVFTPNGDGTNDNFAIKFFSMKSVKVTIFNRWGKVVHVWESSNVRGFIGTAESVPESVWNGKIGGKYASPGVYYYAVEGIGRDNKRRKESGFFHLFRDK